jgi:hypothetical protein
VKCKTRSKKKEVMISLKVERVEVKFRLHLKYLVKYIEENKIKEEDVASSDVSTH